MKEKKMIIYAEDKSAGVILQTGISPVIIQNSVGFWGYSFPDTPEVKDALDSFASDIPLPARSFASLCKSLKGQLMSMKNQGEKRCQR